MSRLSEFTHRVANRFGLEPLSLQRVATARLRWWPKFTRYKIVRNCSNDTGFFVVNGYGCGRGVGFQLKVGPRVYGVSVVWEERR